MAPSTQPNNLSAEKAAREPGRLWRGLTIGFTALGAVVSSYLIWVKFNPASAFCSGVGDCEAVNSSVYSEFHGIPIAAIGAAVYLLMLALLLLEQRTAWLNENAGLIVLALSFAGVIYSAYLTYIELAVLHKICPYCVVSAVSITLVFVFSSIRIRHKLV